MFRTSCLVDDVPVNEGVPVMAKQLRKRMKLKQSKLFGNSRIKTCKKNLRFDRTFFRDLLCTYMMVKNVSLAFPWSKYFLCKMEICIYTTYPHERECLLWVDKVNDEG